VEADYLEFNAGSQLTLTTAAQKAMLVVPLAVAENAAPRRRRVA